MKKYRCPDLSNFFRMLGIEKNGKFLDASVSIKGDTVILFDLGGTRALIYVEEALARLRKGVSCTNLNK